MAFLGRALPWEISRGWELYILLLATSSGLTAHFGSFGPFCARVRKHWAQPLDRYRSPFTPLDDFPLRGRNKGPRHTQRLRVTLQTKRPK